MFVILKNSRKLERSQPKRLNIKINWKGIKINYSITASCSCCHGFTHNNSAELLARPTRMSHRMLVRTTGGVELTRFWKELCFGHTNTTHMHVITAVGQQDFVRRDFSRSNFPNPFTIILLSVNVNRFTIDVYTQTHTHRHVQCETDDN